ncbi:hypothetical protein [Pseudoalteromonas luteoviolacea]|uniref:Uncharacterized protein n=1 Tax=Pseudoalteromonas luteoviolacea H33 TaxID=1365251 RepID=A0A167FU20_9GAMM|nr:hypothetical protein [Pseudoalteromonas luteoviolacea]KZN52983.1 hypothetical protein N476_09365 [Pseudoalteromonas luteoviolacea H33]KZN78100.1 hypothetical protein N477_10700 [Pseudoalteromonas luteoviolacea H33-S]
MQNAKIKQQKQLIKDKKLLTHICAGILKFKGSGPRQQRIDEYFPTK